MTDKQPDALRLADLLEDDDVMPSIVSMLRTQHAAIERKDALLRLALEAFEGDEWLKKFNAAQAITKELQ